MRFLFLIGLFLPTVAAAQMTGVAPHQVIGVVTGDFDSDGSKDRAVLIDSLHGVADLWLYLSSVGADLNDANTRPSVFAVDVASVGPMWGQDAELLARGDSGLQIISQNEAIGRGRWKQVLTLAYRKGAMRVAGFTYSWRDTLDPANFGTCDVNYLAGRWELQIGDQPVKKRRTNVPALPVEQWKLDRTPDGCLQ